MAIFDKDDFRRINEHLEKLGYPALYFNNNAEKMFSYLGEKSNERYYVSTDNEKLDGFYVQPILVEGNEKGDKYNIFFSKDGDYNTYYVRRALLDLEIQGGTITSNDSSKIHIELVKSGGKYYEGEFVPEELSTSQGEFASFDNFENIDAPDYSVVFGENPQVSEASRRVDVEALTDSQFKKAQEKIQKCKDELTESLSAKEEGVLETAMWTFDEVDELYNSQITTDDKRAFFIYWQNKSRKALEGGFSEKYGSSYPAQAVDILELMKKGALFFDPTAKFGERLQPKAIYQSGNIWKKDSSLTNQKDYYIQRFGEDIYNIHVEIIKPIYQEEKYNRLRVGGEDKSMMATILPVSDLAETIKIEQVVNPRDRAIIEENFRIYTSWKKGAKVEDISGYGDGTARINYINKKSLSLKDGFIRWCSMAGSGLQAQEVGIQWSAITTNIGQLEDYYLKPKQNPFGKEKGGEEKWARYQDDARKVGIRLFAQFLSTGLVAKDQTKVEVIFNSTYNAYREPNLEQVPIGFTYKKYLDNRGLFLLKKSNLNAIRYYLTRGSIGLAYGVGLGKTFCSIFAMKQALDLGMCKRALVIVPNQVYYQFGQEVLRGLGKEFDPKISNSRLNMFYNSSGIYNELGNNAVDGINLCTYEATETFAFHKDGLSIDADGRITDEWIIEAVNILEMGGDGAVANPTILDGFLKSHSQGLFNIEVDIDNSEDLELSSDDFDNGFDDSNKDSDVDDDDFDLGEFAGGGGVDDAKPKKEEVTYLNVASTNFDFVVVDEAHNFNNLFSKVVSAPKDVQGGDPDKKTGKVKIRREINPYSKIRETAGGKKGSARAEKLWWLSKFIQAKNKTGNTILLSATPFTNSPLQLFTMLAYLNYEMLSDAQIGILKDFFDLFAKIEYAEDFKTDLSIVKRNKLIGWNNVICMQKFVYRVFDKSSREDEDKAVIRPNKIVLPLKRMLVGGKMYEFGKENYISTTIKLSETQKTLWDRVRDYAGGKDNPATGTKFKYEDVCNPSTYNTTSLGKYTIKKKNKKITTTDEESGAEVDIENADDLADGTREGEKAKDSAKALQCLMWGRQICLNPYLFKCSGLTKEPNGKDYVEKSPKLLYVMNCIAGVKKYHEESEDSPFMSGQVIYMNFGVSAFPLLRNYLIEELGFDANEIGIISGQGNYIGKKRYDNKQKVADAFLGRVLDSETGEYTTLEESKRVKVLIGSEAIKEGINLQDYASVLYNCFLDFNPTDMVQVEGRIWRQGNAFANVRIVTPLMSDCIDVFMFQKLEDKTERINQIWTRNGNANELDTSAFNPAELKYELLSDPIAIAQLEREYRKDKIDEEVNVESEVLSRYIGLSNVWDAGEKVLFPKINSTARNDFRFSMYYKISQLRPDLIQKPLFDEDEWKNFLRVVINTDDYKNFGNTRYNNFDDLYKSFSNPFLWSRDSKYALGYTESWMNWEYNQDSKNTMYREWLGKIFNYSAQDLVELMVQVYKEQKIAYPRGYASNWRELMPKRQVPIVEGDEVEFDTKKGRKKGVAELVVDNYGNLIISNFYYQLSYQVRNNETDKKNYEDAIQKLKLKNVDVSKNDFDTLDENAKKELATILRYYYKENPNLIMGGELYNYNLIPNALDVDDLEDLNIKDKNIVRIAKKGEGEEKEVKPNKYPDPVTYSNKNLIEIVKEIREYQIVVNYQKYSAFVNKQLSKDEEDMVVKMVSLPIEEQVPFFTEPYNDIIGILVNESTRDRNYFNYLSSKDSDGDYSYWSFEYNLPKTWIDFEENSVEKGNSMFKMSYSKFYDFQIPRDIAEFVKTKEKQFIPMGINNKSDIDTLVNGQKEKINTLQLEKTQLDDQQVFDELVQEVTRTMDALNSEEIRKGASYVARAELFGNPNPDYLGNAMLSIFQNADEEELRKIDIKFRPSERAIAYSKEQRTLEGLKKGETLPKTKKPKATKTKVEVIEVIEEGVLDEKQATMLLIADLEEALEYMDSEEQTTTQGLIDDLKEALDFM
jgi:hypothetical protein